MPDHRARTAAPPARTLALVALNGLLLALVAATVALGVLRDAGSGAVERTIERYARGVEVQDIEAALAEIAPAERDRWAEWIAGQLGNIYTVTGVAVRAPSLFDQLVRGEPPGAREAIVSLDVNRGYPGEFYQPTTRVGVAQHDGRWYLVEPLLAPEATAQ